MFVATNPFLSIPSFSLNPQGDWIPEEVNVVAKERRQDTAVSWQKISELCDFQSIQVVNRALQLTGSKRIKGDLVCPSDTDLLWAGDLA